MFKLLLDSGSNSGIYIFYNAPLLADAAFLCVSAYLEDIMKKLALAVAITAVASTAVYAGGMDAPMMEEAVMVEHTTSSSAGGMVVPILLLLLVAAAVASN